MSAEDAAAAAKVDLDDVDKFDDAALDETPAPDAAEPEAEAKPETEAKPEADEKPEEETAEKEPAPEPAKESRPKRHMMPKERYDYQASKRREAETRNQELEQRNQELQDRIAEIEQQQHADVAAAKEEQTQQISDLEARISRLDEEAEELRADGDRKAAAAKVTEVRKLERQINKLEMEVPEVPDAGQIRTAALAQMREEIALENVINAAEEDYPVLKQGAENHDPEMVDEVMDLYDSMLAKGTRPALAMERAVGYVTRSHGLSAVETTADTRTKEAKQRNLRAAKNQPPDLNDIGSSADTAGATKPMDIMHMTIEEYEKLGIDEDKFLS